MTDWTKTGPNSASGSVSEQIIFDKGLFNRAIESPTDPLRYEIINLYRTKFEKRIRDYYKDNKVVAIKLCLFNRLYLFDSGAFLSRSWIFVLYLTVFLSIRLDLRPEGLRGGPLQTLNQLQNVWGPFLFQMAQKIYRYWIYLFRYKFSWLGHFKLGNSLTTQLGFFPKKKAFLGVIYRTDLIKYIFDNSHNRKKFN